MYTRTGRGAWGARHMLTHHLRPPARSRPRRDGAGRWLGQPRWLRLRSGLQRVQPSTTYLARHLPPISLSAPAPRSPARRRRRRCHPPSRPRRWPRHPADLRGSRAIGPLGLPAPALRVRRSALPSPHTLPFLASALCRALAIRQTETTSGRLSSGCENVSLRGPRRTRSSSKRSRQRKLQRNNAMSKRARGGVNLWCFVPPFSAIFRLRCRFGGIVWDAQTPQQAVRKSRGTFKVAAMRSGRRRNAVAALPVRQSRIAEQMEALLAAERAGEGGVGPWHHATSFARFFVSTQGSVIEQTWTALALRTISAWRLPGGKAGN